MEPFDSLTSRWSEKRHGAVQGRAATALGLDRRAVIWLEKPCPDVRCGTPNETPGKSCAANGFLTWRFAVAIRAKRFSLGKLPAIARPMCSLASGQGTF